jgi:arylsulfatase A-like enzyme
MLLFFIMGCSKEVPSQDFHTNIRNVIIVGIDTLRAENLGFMGYSRPTSPFVDELSKRCIIFDCAYTPKARTLPAFTSLFSGKHVINHRVIDNGIVLPEELHLLIEDFREAGFSTIGFPAAPNMSLKYGINKGFDYYADIPDNQLPAPTILNMVKRFLEGNPKGGEASYLGETKPLFLFIHFFDPHTPYTPKPSILSQFADPSYNGPFDGQLIPTIRDYNNYELELNEEDLKHALDRYDAEIRTLDDYLRELFDLFDKMGLMDNSIIVFTADHGENLGEHHHICHGHPYEQALKIPLMFHFPNDFRAGLRINALVELTDVLPTVMDIINLQATTEIDGMSLLPLMKNPSSPELGRRYLLTLGLENKEGKPTYALFDGTYRLIKDIIWSEKSVLYNIADDPHENKNIASDNPELVELMESVTVLMAAGLKPPNISDAKIGEEPLMQEMDPETEEMLRSLGYIN